MSLEPRRSPPRTSDPETHVVQFYGDDVFLVDRLVGFVEDGLVEGEAVLVAVTQAHLDELERRLSAQRVDLAAARREGHFVPLEAGATLARLLVDGAPDAGRFARVVGDAIRDTAQRHPRVRVFGEMVALLWRDGQRHAALELERLWTDLARSLPFHLACAYPLAGFDGNGDAVAMRRVCDAHDEILPAEGYAADAGDLERMRAIVELQRRAQVREDEHLERSRLAAIVESSDDAIVGQTLDGVVTSWNAGAERIFGWTADEIVGQPVARLIPADCSEDLPTILGTVRRGERVHHYETQRLRRDGQRIHVSLTVSPILDRDGTIAGASKIARDITNRRRAEEALRQQRAMLDTLYEVGLTLGGELDLDKVLQTVTDAATTSTGARFGAFFYKQGEDAGGAYQLSALSGAPRAAFEGFGMPRDTPLFRATFSGEGVVRADDVTTDPRFGQNAPHHGMPDGHLPVASYLAVPVVGRGGAVFGGLFLGHPEAGVFTEQSERMVVALAAQAAVAIDNARLYETERRLRDEAERASRTKDEFLAMLGHELRNPLSSVRNAIVSASLDPLRRERALGLARRGSDLLVRMVDDLLDVARISSGKIALRRERVRLASVVERAVESTRELVEERAHQLTVSVADEPLEVDGDQTRLEQVAMNLLTNAAKYTERGGHVRVAVAREGDDAVLRVRDDGVGIPPDLLARVFDLFAQGERGLERASGGLGIGLTVVRRIVELHGGAVEAHSEGLGTGTEFVVRLPALPRAAEAASPPAASAAAMPRRARLLVVEDHPDVAEGVVMLLELLGHDVQLAPDGDAALSLARANPPEAMLIDIGLPGMDGYEVARHLRADPTFAGVVLIALTGYGRLEDRQRAYRGRLRPPSDEAGRVPGAGRAARRSAAARGRLAATGSRSRADDGVTAPEGSARRPPRRRSPRPPSARAG
jgi:PAS domain S-box-containing protein